MLSDVHRLKLACFIHYSCDILSFVSFDCCSDLVCIGISFFCDLYRLKNRCPIYDVHPFMFVNEFCNTGSASSEFLIDHSQIGKVEHT